MAAGQPRMYADQQRALGNNRPANNVGQAIFGNTARVLNTAGGIAQETPDTFKLLSAQLTGNKKAEMNALDDLTNVQARTRGLDSGLFKAGTIYNDPNEKLGPLQTAKRFVPEYLGAAGEIAPMPAAKAFKGANLGVRAGKVGLASGVANLAADTGQQSAEAGRFVSPVTVQDGKLGINKRSVTAFGTGAALGTALPIAGAAGRQVAENVVLPTIKARTPLNQVGSIGRREILPTEQAKIRQVAVKDNVQTPDAVDAHKQQTNPQNIQIPQTVTNKDTLRGQFNQALIDKEAPLINFLKNVEKDTGQKNLVEQFYFDTGRQKRSNAIANEIVTSSKPLKEAFGGLKGQNKRDFDNYVAAKAELSNASRGLPTTRPVKELQSTVDTLTPAHQARFENLNKFYQDYADRLRANNIIDDATLAQFKANKDYTRIQRDMEDLAGYRGQGGNSYSFGTSSTKQKRIGSSKRAIQAADVTAFNRAQELEKEIARNNTANNLINVLEPLGLAKKLTSDQAVRKNTIRRIVDGKTDIYEVPRDIKEIADNVTPFQLGALGRIVSAPQRLLRAGATGLSAPFTVANYVKDQVSSGVFSKSVWNTHNPANIATGLYKAAKDFGVGIDDPLWNKFQQHLGDTTQYDFIRNQSSAKDLSREIRLGQAGRAVNRIKHPIRTLEDFNQVTEKATRFQNFKGIYNKVLKETGNEAEATRQATIAAWQNSVDFGRMGDVGQALNLLIPYFNAGIQGSRTLGRAFKQRPVATSAKTIAGVATPLMAITLYNNADAQRKAVYDNISDYEKENNIIVVLPGAKQLKDGSYEGVIKVPLQPGLSNLVQPVRIGVENYANSEPVDVPQMAKQLLGVLSGPVNTTSLAAAGGGLTPQAVKPLVQQAANKDFFTGKEIVPDYIEKATDSNGNPVPNEQKAYDFTSGSSRILGNLTGQSPIRIDKFIKDTSGKVGQYTQNAADNALAKAGIISPDQVGGVSIGSDFTKRFARATGKENYMKSEGAKYFDNVKEATKGLNGNEQAAFNSLHPNKKNFLGDVISDIDSVYNSAARLDVYNRYPKVFEADKKLDAKGRDKGEPGNPLFDLTPEQLKKVLEKENLPPGASDKELSKLYTQDWYQDYSNKKSAFFTAIKDKSERDLRAAANAGDQKKYDQLKASIDKFNSSDNPYPVTPPELQKQMDAYSALPKGTGARKAWIQANPGAYAAMKDQYARIDNWQNKQRQKRGLDTTEGAEGVAKGYDSGSSGSKGYSKGRSGDRGSGGGGSGGSEYKYAIDLQAGGSIAKPKVKKPTGGKAKIAKKTGGKIKTSIKKAVI